MARPAGSFENDCMSTETDRHTSVEAAISEVLAAERDALAQIAACEDRAGQIMRNARRAVRAMVRRTQDRISRLHAGCAEKTRELVATMEQEASLDAARALPENDDAKELAEAVASVARELTEPDSPDAG
jgi:vacuolar-type H+-ATPase subunit H